MNKYIVKATLQVLAIFGGSVIFASVIYSILELLQPTGMQLLAGGLVLVFSYVVVNVIKVQASILESRDKLNRKG